MLASTDSVQFVGASSRHPAHPAHPALITLLSSPCSPHAALPSVTLPHPRSHELSAATLTR